MPQINIRKEILDHFSTGATFRINDIPFVIHKITKKGMEIRPLDKTQPHTKEINENESEE